MTEGRVLVIVGTTKNDREAAFEITEKFKDQDSNLTDATSFAVMERMGIGSAFTFDSHFKIHGFEMVP